MTRPLLFLDVDGPLNPFEAAPTRRPAGYRTHRMRPVGWDRPWQQPLRVWLNPEHGARLAELPYDLVWATTWGAQANEWIGPHIGLPDLPVVDWSAPPAGAEEGMYFKTHDVVRYAAGRPFAWIDDEIGRPDRAYVARSHIGPALLHRVDATRGLVDDDFHTLRVWADALAAGAA